MSSIEWLDEPLIDGYGRITLGRYGGWTVDVLPTMLFNDRLVLTPENSPGTYDYGWCYQKGGAAFAAAFAWDPDVEGEPVGYIKAVGEFTRQPGEINRFLAAREYSQLSERASEAER